MPPWFIDMESATEAAAKSNATPPAVRTATHASRANSPSSALHGVTRPSVEATPTNGLARSASDSPRARRNARCGARSSPRTVTRDGKSRLAVIFDGSFFVFTHDFLDIPAVRKAEARRALGARSLWHRVHDRLERGVRLEPHAPFGPVLH